MSKVKDKERILKAAREKQFVTYKLCMLHKAISRNFNRNFAGRKGVAKYIQSIEK